MKYRWWICLAAILVSSCRSASPGSTVSPGTVEPLPSPTAPPSVATSRNRVWQIHPAITSAHYQIISTTTLELDGIRDTLKSATTVSLNTQPADTAITFSGTIDSTMFRAGVRIGSPEKTPQLPIAFSGTLSRKAIRTTSPPDCTPAAISPGALIPKIAIAFPETTLTTGMTWSDSLTTTTCSGDIPVSTTVLRSFQIIGQETAQGLETVVISRTDRLQAEGSGTENQHRVEVTMAGTGTARLWIDTTNGQLIQSTSEFSGTTGVTASGRKQIFKQVTVELIEKRN